LPFLQEIKTGWLAWHFRSIMKLIAESLTKLLFISQLLGPRSLSAFLIVGFFYIGVVNDIHYSPSRMSGWLGWSTTGDGRARGSRCLTALPAFLVMCHWVGLKNFWLKNC
jgi:hypothetical protein